MASVQKASGTQEPTLSSNVDGKKRGLVMEQYGKIEDMNREFDVAFWQAQDTAARLNAGWELVAYYLKRKGREDELRLQRSIESFQRK